MRLLTIDPILLRVLAKGAPGLHDALARAISATGLSPEIHVLRDGSAEPSPRWSLVVEAQDFIEELELDVRISLVAAAAVPLLVGAVIDEVRREFPGLLSRPEVTEALLRLVLAGSQAAARGRPS